MGRSPQNLENFKKLYIFHCYFYKILKTSPASGGVAPRKPPRGDPSHKPSLGGPLASPPSEKFVRALMIFETFLPFERPFRYLRKINISLLSTYKFRVDLEFC